MKKSLSSEEEDLSNSITTNYIRSISGVAFLGLGVWMLLDPSKPKHKSVERVTEALVKEIWGPTTGIVFLSIAALILGYSFYQIWKKRSLTYLKLETGYYFFKNQMRVSGLVSDYNNKDLILFHPEYNEVIELRNYTNAKNGSYHKAYLSNQFTCSKSYWSRKGTKLSFFYLGTNADFTLEWQGDDIVVTVTDAQKKFRFNNFKSQAEGQLFEATML